LDVWQEKTRKVFEGRGLEEKLMTFLEKKEKRRSGKARILVPTKEGKKSKARNRKKRNQAVPGWGKRGRGNSVSKKTVSCARQRRVKKTAARTHRLKETERGRGKEGGGGRVEALQEEKVPRSVHSGRSV